ncbi:SDR family oxidoreductase [Streptacidiphilus sp. P02-A3a]|uniref:SDR family oxidoreductase n=1 Tax=Streptacidiphilus sp. P02-A3a TaxID=2704468 RepID=UPI0015F90F23|nr:SDR family oxidoreductase [Streptacidiphilus sp. P02-A3a]QMU70086.1 SDR family oxidoreductase [Streptacidiphilus sp. P02-A3a]QMU70461.1 SDR family oxidoreductase [Streptacidiphilus sp. P02-A3a]
MSLIVTGATGHLGRLTVQALLERGVPAGDIVATGRRPELLKDLAERGVRVRAADYGDPASLRAALQGADRVLLVSSSATGAARVEQHRNVIEAAGRAGAALVAYSSIVNADTATLRLAQDHRATEALLRASGVPFTFLRNSWYLENYTAQLAVFLEHGTVVGGAGQGRVSAAARADYAAAAAAVLTGDGHQGRAYELGGDEPFTLTQLAAEITAQAGTQVSYTDLPEAGHAQALVAAGLPAPVAGILADADQGLRRGELFTDSGDLARLIGRPTTRATAAIATALDTLRTA